MISFAACRPEIRARLAEAAAIERDRRAAERPGQVRAGLIDAEDANEDYHAWCCIAEIVAGRSLVHPYEWDHFVAAAQRGLEECERLLAAAPDSRRLRRLRECVWLIADILARHRDWLAETNRQLRARAGRSRAA